MNLKAAKYWALFVSQLKTVFEYGADFIIKLARQPIKLVLLIVFWKTVFALTQRSSIAGMNETEFMTYMIVAGLIGFSLHPWLIYEIVDENIKKGKLSALLTRPISHLPYVFAKSMKDPFFDFLAPIPLVILLFIFEPFGISLMLPSLAQGALFMVSLFLGLFLSFMVVYTISLWMFWTGDLWSIWGTLDSLQLLLSGQAIPLTIAPLLNNIANFFPFKHIVFTPSFIFIGEYTFAESLIGIACQLAWIAGLLVLSAYLLKRGLRKFDSQGG